MKTLRKQAKKEIKMIIDFTIKNFRSIKEKQTFSLHAESSSNHLSDNIASPGDGKVSVFRTAGIYGANASGKSNLLLAFEALRFIVCSSGDLKDNETMPNYEPFLLADSCKEAPTEFEIEFFSDDQVRFLYKVAYDAKRIITESLDYYPSGTKANLFNRKEYASWEDVTFGGFYKGGKKRFAFFDNNSYISKAGNSADAPKLVRSIFNLFRTNILHLAVHERVSILGWREDQELVNSIASILSKVDTGIFGVEFKTRSVKNIKIPSDFPDSIRKKILNSERKNPFFPIKANKILKWNSAKKWNPLAQSNFLKCYQY